VSPRYGVQRTLKRPLIRLADYERELTSVPAEARVSIEAELEALPEDKKRAEQVKPIDCPDCGRTLAYRGSCAVCGGKSWLPAGHVDRFALKRLREAETKREGGEG
jgi:hypothetical protein